MTIISLRRSKPVLRTLALVIYVAGVNMCIAQNNGAATEQEAMEPLSTKAVLCEWSESIYNDDESVKLESQSNWSCSDTQRTLSANGIPDHEIGTFPNAHNPNSVSAQKVAVSYTLTPALSDTTSRIKEIGHALNGVKFDPGTAGTCDDTGSNCSMGRSNGAWRIEALGQSSFNFGEDMNNAHVQPGGSYHYHGMPENLIKNLSNDKTSMTLVGWASDGFPIYARYGYSVATDANSELKILTGSYQLKPTPDAGRPSTDLYPMGTFSADYEYMAGSGDVDECNGRTGVTPEFPNGTYYYTITDSYPYIQRCVKGTPSADSRRGPPPAGSSGPNGHLPRTSSLQ